MFYRKTDLEILCETLVKLAEKQEKFIDKFGADKKSPYETAMHSIMLQIESHMGLAPRKKVEENEIPTIGSTLKIKAFEAINPAKKKKTSHPAGRFFKGTKPPIQVIHGHSDDTENLGKTESGIIGSKPQEPMRSVTEEVYGTQEYPSSKEERIIGKVMAASPSPIIPEVKEVATPENIDDLTAKLADAFDQYTDPVPQPMVNTNMAAN